MPPNVRKLASRASRASAGESYSRKLIQSREGEKYLEDASKDEELGLLGLVLVVEFFLRLKFLLVQVKSVKRGDDLFAISRSV